MTLRKRRIRHLFSLFALGIFAVLAAGTAGDDEEGESGGSTSSNATGGGGYAVGQAVTVGDTTVTVTEVTSAQRVGGEFVNHTAGTGAALVLVRYSETNNGNETLTVLGSPFKLVDAEDRRFEPSSRAEGAVAAQENLEILPQLQPGLAHDGVAVFEVPEAVARGSVRIEFTERGFLGSDTALITAQVAAPATAQVVEAAEAAAE